MENQSFTHLEHLIKHDFNKHINHNEGAIDLDNHFCLNMLKLLKEALRDNSLNLSDLQFTAAKAPYYSLSEKITNNPVYQNSDLTEIINKFAKTTHDHLVRYQRKDENRDIDGRNQNQTE